MNKSTVETHRWSHHRQSIRGSVASRVASARRERSSYVRTKLHRYSNRLVIISKTKVKRFGDINAQN